MNLRHFTMALLISALPTIAVAGTEINLNKGDFVAAEKVNHDGETVVSVKLSKSGKAKFKKLNKTAVGEKIHIEIADVTSDLTLRAPITGDSLEMGPYSAEEAGKVVAEINQR